MKAFTKTAVVLVLALCCALGFAACGNGRDNELQANADVTITFWNPITGPDSSYMQELVSAFNEEHEGEIYVRADAQAEANHYQRILTSFTDGTTADLCLVHKSRLSAYQRAERLRDMTDLLADIGVSEEDYVGDSWASGQFDGKMYAAPYDVLPTVLFYNRNLIPAGYTEADILSPDFTVDKMIEMMVTAYVDAPMSSRKTYGMSFNYSYTEQMFLSFLSQQDVAPVSADAPTEALYDSDAGYAAAQAVVSISSVKNNSGIKVTSESGADHLNIFMQGRALFTIDGIWSAPDACSDANPDRLDAGVALLPKLDSSVSSRSVAADGHSFVMFKNNSQSDEKDAAVAEFMQYLIENSGTWCRGGKIAARADIAEDETYQALEWGYLSESLADMVSPVKVYTYDTLVDPIGTYVAQLCERATDSTVTYDEIVQAVNRAATDGEQAAAQL